jgi:hypothetical protein
MCWCGCPRRFNNLAGGASEPMACMDSASLVALRAWSLQLVGDAHAIPWGWYVACRTLLMSVHTVASGTFFLARQRWYATPRPARDPQWRDMDTYNTIARQRYPTSLWIMCVDCHPRMCVGGVGVWQPQSDRPKTEFVTSLQAG